MKQLLLAGLMTLLTVCSASAADTDTYLYKAMFVRAAPGKLLELIALYKDRMPVYDAAGDARPFWMRHSQGDQWDIMFLFPLGSWSEYFSAERIAKRDAAGARAKVPQSEFARRFYEVAVWHEDVFVEGPPLDLVKKNWG